MRLSLTLGCSNAIKTAVDIGCGTGNISPLIIEKVPFEKLIAFDLSPEMIEFARREYANDKTTFEVANICWPWEKLAAALNVPRNSVDVALSVHCFHWISDEEKQQAMDNVSAMLSEGNV